MTIASLAFLEPPRELLVTNRLQRHMLHGTGWRFWLAKYICDHLSRKSKPPTPCW